MKFLAGTLARPLTAIACVLTLLTPIAPAAPETGAVRAEITRIPSGASIKLRLKNRKTLRGTRGEVSESRFILVDRHSREHPIAFEDVDSVKLVTQESHTGRNILIGVGIGIGAVAIVIVALAHSGGYL